MATYTVTASQREANKKGTSGSSGSVGTSNSNANNTVQYDPNVDYASLIQSAVQRGESQSVIDSLNAQRNAKISGMGLNQSALTADDIAGYKSTANGTGRTTYDSAGVIGNMDNGNYGIQQGTGNGYGYGNGYGNRETAYTFDMGDGTKKTVYSNATMWEDAAKLNGLDPNLSLIHI